MVRRSSWHGSAERAELMALYEEADRAVSGWSCRCAAGDGGREASACCHFGRIGREPYPTAVELAEVHDAMERLTGRRPLPRAATEQRSLPVVDLRPCPLLDGEGRCRIYASRPLGCRTFFCADADTPGGPRARPLRDSLSSIGRRVADLSARFAPRDPHPRPLLRALARPLASPGAGARREPRER
ncbi:MAG: YkgJ family cysteine cluster protein [Myxococcales bacterium]|nr:YkgJ family cysteine cluster protein [Myxococcales bacterium]